MQVWIFYIEAVDETGPSIEVYATEAAAMAAELRWLQEWRAVESTDEDGPLDSPITFVQVAEVQP